MITILEIIKNNWEHLRTFKRQRSSTPPVAAKKKGRNQEISKETTIKTSLPMEIFKLWYVNEGTYESSNQTREPSSQSANRRGVSSEDRHQSGPSSYFPSITYFPTYSTFFCLLKEYNMNAGSSDSASRSRPSSVERLASQRSRSVEAVESTSELPIPGRKIMKLLQSMLQRHAL